MVAINEVRPADPGGDPREPHLADRTSPVSVAWGEPMTFEGSRAGQGLQGLARGRAQAPRALAVARRAPRARPPARRDTAPMRPRGEVFALHQHFADEVTEVAGTVRRRLPECRQVDPGQPPHRVTGRRRPRAGVLGDRKELYCEWNGVTFRVIDTEGVDREDAGPFGTKLPRRRGRRSRRRISCSS